MAAQALDRPDAVAPDVPARHEAGARRRALRGARVGLSKTHSLAGQSVEVRRFVVSAAVAAEFGQAEVVREDEDNAGRPLRRTLRLRQDRGRRAQEAEAEERRCGSGEAHTMRRWAALPSISGPGGVRLVRRDDRSSEFLAHERLLDGDRSITVPSPWSIASMTEPLQRLACMAAGGHTLAR